MCNRRAINLLQLTAQVLEETELINEMNVYFEFFTWWILLVYFLLKDCVKKRELFVYEETFWPLVCLQLWVFKLEKNAKKTNMLCLVPNAKNDAGDNFQDSIFIIHKYWVENGSGSVEFGGAIKKVLKKYWWFSLLWVWNENKRS